MRIWLFLLFAALVSSAEVQADIDTVLSEANQLLLADKLEASTKLLTPVVTSPSASDRQRAQALISLSTIALFNYDLELMRERAEQALALAAAQESLALQQADALRLLDSYYGETGDYEKALALVEEEIELRKTRVAGQAKLERALIGKAITLAQLGLLRRAELTILEAYEVARKQDPGGHVTEELIRVNHGYILSLRKQFKAARQLYAASVAYRRQHQPKSTRMANALANLSEVELALGEFASAAAHVAQGLGIVTSAAPGSRVHSDLLRLRAKIEQGSGASDVARQSLHEAVQLYRAASPNSAELLVPLTELGRALLNNGELNAAENAFEEARRVGMQQVPQTGNFAKVLHGLAAVDRARGRPDAALALLRESVDALDIQYAVIGASAQDIADYASEYQIIHDDLAAVLLEQRDLAGALNAVDRFRERVLLERIRARSSLRRNYAANPEIQLLDARRRDLLDQIAAANRPSDRRSLNAQLDQVRRALNLKTVEVAAPRGLTTQNDFDVVGASRAALAPSQAIIAFARIHADYHRFVISAQGVTHQVVGPAARLEKQAETLRAMLDNEIPPATFQPLMKDLSAALLGNSTLAWGKTDRILLVVDGALQILPFAALPVPETGEALVTAATLGFANSIAAWLGQSKLRSGGLPSEFSGFAYSGADNSLRFVEDEVRGAAATLSGDLTVAIGSGASETLAKNSRSRILHFAAHAELDAGDAYQSYVQLAPSETDDGLLEVFEIMRSDNLNADLVVLSACETALGTRFAGEGMLGLAKAFAYTGIPQVVASLWRLEDQSTAVLMQTFYEGLADGLDTAAALRVAQLSLLQGKAGSFWWRLNNRDKSRQFRHPRYWAGFTLIGAF